MMIKKIFLIALLLGSAWWYWKERTTLSESKVTTYYMVGAKAILGRQAEESCGLLADEYQGIDSTVFGGVTVSEREMNKTQGCQAYRELSTKFNELDQKLGGFLNLNYSYRISNIALSPDKKTATVNVSYSLDANQIAMHIKSNSIDTLVRSQGKTYLLRSNSETTMSVQ